MAIAFCPRCGAARGGRFCATCGLDFAPATPPAESSPPAPWETAAGQSTAESWRFDSTGPQPAGAVRPASASDSWQQAVQTPPLQPFAVSGHAGASGSSVLPKVLALGLVLVIAAVGVFMVTQRGSGTLGPGNSSPGASGAATPAASALATARPSPSPSPKWTPVPGSSYKGLIVPTFSFPLDVAHGVTLGSATAPVTVGVWSDEQCPPCAVFWAGITDEFVNRYLRSGRARIVFYDFPVVDTYKGATGESKLAAIATRAADKQGQFWPFLAWVLANQHDENSGWITQANLDRIADALDMDVAQFERDCQDPEITKYVANSYASALGRGLTAAPQAMIEGTTALIGAGGLTFAKIAAAIDAVPLPSPSASVKPSRSPSPTPGR
jgi:protein-disulfide isomerase